MKELYLGTVTDSSLNELEEFAKWYNEKLGNYPVIVGGWAVYFYTHGLGSKDIDVVFLGSKTKHMTLFDYFRSHGYIERSRSFFDKEFVKLVKTNSRDVEIIVDAVSSNRIIIFDGKKARLPWNWAVKNSIQHKVGNSVIYLPTPELLFVYKLGAILGRNDLLRTGFDVSYYRSKLWKDVYDVVSLSKLNLDKKGTIQFFNESKLYLYKNDIFQIIEDNLDDEIKLLLKFNSLDKLRSLLDEDVQ